MAEACPALDTTRAQPYSLPFRTKRLETNKQRPVGSVGVEALLDRRAIFAVVDNYCGVNGKRPALTRGRKLLAY